MPQAESNRAAPAEPSARRLYIQALKSAYQRGELRPSVDAWIIEDRILQDLFLPAEAACPA